MSNFFTLKILDATFDELFPLAKQRISAYLGMWVPVLYMYTLLNNDYNVWINCLSPPTQTGQ